MSLKLLFSTCILVTVVVASAAPSLAEGGSVTVVSFGGSYGESIKQAFLAPFQRESSIKTNMVDYNGGLGELSAQVETGNVTWDVVDLEMQDLVRACDDGLLETLTKLRLPDAADGTDPKADFVEGTLQDCGVGNIIWSTVIAFNDDMFPGDKPSKMADFFDLERFPGKRGLMKKPQAVLEWALIADGVDAKDVYDVLATPDGVERALSKLDTIRDHVVWWDAHAQAPQLLADKEVAMTMAANGRIYTAAAVGGKPFTTIWDRQIWAPEFWAIPKGAHNIDAAKKFIAFAARPEQMAVQASNIAYGPARKSAAELADDKMRPYLPTEKSNFATAIHNDVEFWADHGDSINERFVVWLSK
ncbi:putative spermidine/putrescine transport system substrate-binding protein [Sinorhizobium kostiense]|uniref:Spermidine/putrescine transport system substrate-binding protein n=1 Tax=Sinorhizobium kostiense TaxID=76747 RepID=A0ABS4QZQ7_9HYPH|nr:ABC transporter substrate-binding protein [Sinorhizobium kostiense]MBP2236122.1 putative spermidine/putrescine transport system substrate-binding protein [Sinorhizobium kostiense]